MCLLSTRAEAMSVAKDDSFKKMKEFTQFYCNETRRWWKAYAYLSDAEEVVDEASRFTNIPTYDLYCRNWDEWTNPFENDWSVYDFNDDVHVEYVLRVYHVLQEQVILYTPGQTEPCILLQIFNKFVDAIHDLILFTCTKRYDVALKWFEMSDLILRDLLFYESFKKFELLED